MGLQPLQHRHLPHKRNPQYRATIFHQKSPQRRHRLIKFITLIRAREISIHDQIRINFISVIEWEN